MAKSTRGYCKYCGKEYTRTGMLKHLQSCKKRMEVCENSEKMSAYYELMLYGTYNKDYWLIIQIKENATLEEDFFVRTKDELVPVEVKANKNRSKSLRKLIDNESYSDIKWGIKLADSNVGIENSIYTFPYFCTFLLKRYLRGK